MNLAARGVPRVFLLFSLLLTLMWPLPARAGGSGTLTVTRKDLQEAAGGWKVMATIKLPKKPLTPHVAMRFIFTPLVIYETYLDDTSTDKKTRTIPQGKDVQPNVESMDVGFSNPSGDTFDVTKFDFTIRRERNFFAGEYRMEVRDTDNVVIGQPITLKLLGENEVIDRRAMTFSGKKKETTKGAAGANAGSSGETSPATNTTNDAMPASDEGAEPPAPVEKKSGGCGCEVPGRVLPGAFSSWVLAALAVSLVAARRQRR